MDRTRQQLDELGVAEAWLIEIFTALQGAGGAVCQPGEGQVLGATLQSASQYPAGMRDAVARVIGEGISIASVASNGAAGNGGLKVRDRIVAVGDTPLGAGGGARAEIDRAYAAIEERNWPVTLTVRRGGKTMELRLSPLPGCPGRLELVPAASRDAYSDSRYVTVTSGQVRRAGDADAMAFVLGHEMAHGILRRRGTALSGIPLEHEADRIGLYLAARAGFDPWGAVRYWDREAGDIVQSLGSIGHPAPARRKTALTDEATRIDDLRKRGMAIMP